MTRIHLPPEPWREPDAWMRETAMLAHDIRSALTGVVGGLAVLDRARLDPNSRMQIDRVAAAAETLTALLGDVLGDVVQPRLAPAQAEVISLSGFLDTLRRRWVGQAAAKGLSLHIDAEAGLPAGICVSPIDLLRVLGNLIGNAVKFTPKGLVQLTIVRQPGGGITFTLQDDGPGIGECSPERLFEFGVRVGNSAEAGQGIGLHIAKTLSDRMGAELRIASRNKGGLEAVLRMPASLCLEDLGMAENAGSVPADLEGAYILLAEDNPTNQMVASQMLTSMNASVAVVGDGIEALALFEREHFDLVVVDIEMPRMSGLDVIRKIRARTDRRARTPIVALTAYAMQEHRLRIAEAGADGLISKPITSTEAFGRTVRQHLQTAPWEAEAFGEDAVEGEPIIDLATFQALADAIGSEMMAELFDRIVADLESVRQSLEAALDPLDAASIRASTHILISVAGAFGAARLRRRAADLNAAAHAGTGPELASGVRACLGEIEPAMDFARVQRTAC